MDRPVEQTKCYQVEKYFHLGVAGLCGLLPREVDRLDMCPVSVSQSEHDGDSLREEMPESLPVELSVW